MKDKQLISEITLDLSAPVEARLPRAADELVLADALQAVRAGPRNRAINQFV